MAYRVDLTPQAVSDIEAIVEYISQAAPGRLKRWFSGLVDAVNSLSNMPERSAIAPESQEIGREIRQLLYGKRTGIYRIIFCIYTEAPGEGVVRVLSILHGSRDELKAEDLSE